MKIWIDEREADCLLKNTIANKGRLSKALEEYQDVTCSID